MKIHMVKSGDTMYTIAKKHGVQLEQLIAFNPQISNPDQIDVGMKVKIPSASIHDGSTGMEYAHKHVVVQGDSLWKISKAWGLPLKALVDANLQLKNPSVLLTGEVVNIPKQGSMANPTMNHPANMGTMHAMNVNPIVSPVSNMPNMANSLSPAYTPIPNATPQPIAATPQPIAATPQPIAATQPVSVTEPTPKPLEHKVQPENKMPMLDKFQEESLKNYPSESNKEMMNVYSSESLFMQYDIPAVEANANVGYPPPAYQQPTWNAAEMPQWEPTNNYAAPDYAAKPDCGCGGNANVMPYANEMPYNAYPTPYSAMPTYYVPQPMLAYSMQPQEQQSPMQFPVSPSSTSPYNYMVPCYPMGAYGDMGYLHGMQSSYSPWMSSNDNMAPNQSLADTTNNPADINEQMNAVQESPSKKQTQIPRKPAGSTQHKQGGRAVLHEFLQKKSSRGASTPQYKINEPWMNR